MLYRGVKHTLLQLYTHVDSFSCAQKLYFIWCSQWMHRLHYTTYINYILGLFIFVNNDQHQM